MTTIQRSTPSSASGSQPVAAAAAPAAAAPAAAPHQEAPGFPRLAQLAVAEVCKDWAPSRSLAGLPVELAKPIWRELKRRLGDDVACKDMFPFVRDVWHAAQLDLTDADRWLTNSSLAALAFVPTLRTLRLTACQFITDAGFGFLATLPLTSLDVSWTQVSDVGVSTHIARCTSLTSLNLTGCGLTDASASALITLSNLERLSLAATHISDAALDYLTYYTRYPDAGPAHLGVHKLQWLELSNTRITDTGVGKLVAIIEDGVAYGKVFKALQYLALSMTSGVGPSAVRQVRAKYGFDAPLPNKQRTLATSNSVALEADKWVIRFRPTKERELPKPSPPTYEESRVVSYVAQYTKEMAASVAVIARLTAAAGRPLPQAAPADPKRRRVQ